MSTGRKEVFGLLNWYIWTITAVWTLVVLLSLIWNRVHSEQNVLENARIQARTAYQRDIQYRSWNSAHGGVYVPITDDTRPNPFIHAPDRDFTSTSGRRFTLINPAYMLRMVYALGRGPYDIQGHITSLRPIRPRNAPDAWEESALKKFEIGAREVSDQFVIGGMSYMRLMRPLLTEQSCLACHEKQGYREGQIRGGISVSIPMAPLRSALKAYYAALVIGHGALWLFGCGAIGLVAGRLRKQVRQRRHTETALMASEERSRLLVEYAPFGLSIMAPDRRFEYVNPKFMDTFGYTLADIPNKEAWFEKAYPDPEYREMVRSIWTADLAHPAGKVKEIAPKTFTVRGKDGRDRVIRFRNVPLKDGRQLLSYEDISMRVKAERALKESEENLRFLSSGLLTAQENERRRIAYALHDELAQDLAVLTIEVSCIENMLDDRQKDLKDACGKIHRHIVTVIENTRRLSQGLSPALLENLGLTAAIRRMAEDFTEQTAVMVSLDMNDIDGLFRPETSVIVYRIFQEAFTNIRKHAEATRVEVTVMRRGTEVVVCIEDNGRGFQPQEVKDRRRPGKGLGLIAMEERVRMLGKTLHRTSGDGIGTRIVFAVPVDR